MKKLKLTALSENIMKDKEMKAIVGGHCCNCSCYWENRGGSSDADNISANYMLGTESINGCNQYEFCTDGYSISFGYQAGTFVHE